MLRDKLKQPKEADQAIDMMVQSDSKNYKVYLARGRYRLAGAKGASQKALLAGAKDDFEKAKQLASGEPEVYLAMVEAAKESGPDAARRILEDGLKNAPKAGTLYEALAHIEARAGQIDKAIKTLEDGVKSVSESSRLRFSLADLAAQHGATGDDEHRVQYQRKLRLQIEELSKLGFTPLLVRYLSACYHYNNNDFFKARQDLLSLQGARGLTKPEFKAFKAAINVMLAECYRQLRDPEMERAANERAYNADPDGENAQVGRITNLVNAGDTEGAIKAYQGLIKRASPKRAPQFWLQLAKLLIERNMRRPESERDWSEVKTLIDDAAKAAPESVEPVIRRAELLLAQGTVDEARNVLEQARSRFPKSVELWNAEASLLGQQGRVDEALSLLDQAETKLGDRVELRLQRARLWAIRGGPQVVTVLNDLANRAQAQQKNIEPFSKEDRRRLLFGLANELVLQKDLEGAKRLLSQLAEENPIDLDVRLTWLELAFEETASKDDKKYIQQKDDIKKYIQQIERIEGNDGVQGRYCQVQYLIWQVQRAGDKNAQDTLRTEAREKLNELILRRGDWSVIPLALARLGEQELNQGGLDEVQRKTKEESIVSSYLQAIKLGQRGPAVLRRAVTLLFKNGRDNDAFELLNSLPAGSQLVGDLEHQAALIAVEHQDFQRAEQIAQSRERQPW